MRLDVGQISNLRPIFNRPAAGPRKVLGIRDQAGLNRVELDISDNPLKLVTVTYHPIIRLDSPKRLTGQIEHPIRLARSEPLESLRQFGNRNMWSN